MFTKEEIKALCEKEITYEKGKKLADYSDAEIQYEDVLNSRGDFEIRAKVAGSGWEDYDVSIVCNRSGRIIDYSCDCPAYTAYPGMCKHCVAAALEYLDGTRSGKNNSFSYPAKFMEVESDIEVMDMIGTFARKKRMQEQKAEGTIELIPELYEEHRYYYSPEVMHLSFKIGNERKYVVRNFSSFAEAVLNEEQVSYGKQLSFIHCKSAFTEQSWKYVEFILSCVSYYEGRYQKVGKRIGLTEPMLAAFLAISLNQKIEFSSTMSRHSTFEIIDQNPPVKCTLKKTGKNFWLTLPMMEAIEGKDNFFVRQKNKAYRCSGEVGDAIEVLMEYSDSEKEIEYLITEKDMPALCGTVIPAIKQCGLLNEVDADLTAYQPKEAKITYYMDEENGRVTLKANADYGNEMYNLLNPVDFSSQYRNLDKERRALETAGAYFGKRDDVEKILYFPSGDDDAMYHLLNTGIAQMEELGEVYATDRIKLKKIVRSPKAQIGVAMNSGLLELKIDSDEFSKEELIGILDNYKKRKKYYRMKNGDFLNLEDNAVETVAELLSGLALTKSGLKEETIEVPKYRACFIDQILHQGSGLLQVKRDSDYKAIIRDMKNVDDSDYAVPEELYEVLRGYQKTGYRWLRTLSALGFGGILADDMGLGKTVQTIAYLMARMEEAKQGRSGEVQQTDAGKEYDGSAKIRSIIICPASLVYNWKREFETFAPKDARACDFGFSSAA